MYKEIQEQIVADRQRLEDEYRLREADEKRNSEQMVRFKEWFGVAGVPPPTWIFLSFFPRVS